MRRHLEVHLEPCQASKMELSQNKLTDLQKAHIRCLPKIPSVKYFRKNLHFRCLN